MTTEVEMAVGAVDLNGIDSLEALVELLNEQKYTSAFKPKMSFSIDGLNATGAPTRCYLYTTTPLTLMRFELDLETKALNVKFTTEGSTFVVDVGYANKKINDFRDYFKSLLGTDLTMITRKFRYRESRAESVAKKKQEQAMVEEKLAAHGGYGTW